MPIKKRKTTDSGILYKNQRRGHIFGQHELVGFANICNGIRFAVKVGWEKGVGRCIFFQPWTNKGWNNAELFSAKSKLKIITDINDNIKITANLNILGFNYALLIKNDKDQYGQTVFPIVLKTI